MFTSLFTHLAAGLDVTNLPHAQANQNDINNVLNIVYVFSGAIAVLTIVIAGVRFITSKGDPSATTKARNAILFASIGLVIIMLAASITNFVIFKVT